ncbi:MAG: T9SS type A sorting domain-containing protein [Bacteroidales bacterium]|nr:T9SS type A sorting domain-containing protein [Bacteroidales bacterium]
MKQLLILMILSWAIIAQAQDYLIHFEGTGESTTVSSVLVENLTAGTSVTLDEGDELLLTGSVGIISPEFIQSGAIRIYPNPVTDYTLVDIFPPSSGDATVSVYDLTGRILNQTRFYIDISGQEFRISGLANGLYMVDIKGPDYHLSGKLMSTGQPGGLIHINKTGTPVTEVIQNNKKDNKGIMTTVEMAFTSGDRLKFTGSSDNYSTVVTDIPSSNKTITFFFVECTDGGGNHYPVVHIGSAKGGSGSEERKGVQVWIAENLKTTKYNDGTDIPLVTDGTAWLYLTGPGYCWYNNSESLYKDKYGALYNWYAVNTGKLCPQGWHAASHEEWTTMENFLIANGYNYDGSTSENKISKALSSPSDWISNTQPGSPGNTDYPEKINATGFSALPGGYRITMTGAPFNYMGEKAMYWTSTEESNSYSYFRQIDYNRNYVYQFNYGKKMGMSVRCIKD